MAKIIIILALALATAACPKTTTVAPAGNSGSGPQTPQQAIPLIVAQAAAVGFQFEVKVADVNLNGVPDFVLAYLGGKEDETVAFLLGSVARIMAIMAKSAAFRLDLVIVKIGDDSYQAQIADCVKCYDLIGAGAPKEEIAKCVRSAWGAGE